MGVQIAPDAVMAVASVDEPEDEGPKAEIELDGNEGVSLGIDYLAQEKAEEEAQKFQEAWAQNQEAENEPPN